MNCLIGSVKNRRLSGKNGDRVGCYLETITESGYADILNKEMDNEGNIDNVSIRFKQEVNVKEVYRL